MSIRRLVAWAVAGCLAAINVSAFAPAPSPAPADAGALVQRACVGCHALEVITGQGRSAQDWSDVVDRMADRGVDASDAELAQIKAYLAKTYPAAAPAAPSHSL